MTTVIANFKVFFLRGNVAGLAVAVVIGLAFADVVRLLSSGLVVPVITALLGQSHFEALTFTIGESDVYYGLVIDALVAFALRSRPSTSSPWCRSMRSSRDVAPTARPDTRRAPVLSA